MTRRVPPSTTVPNLSAFESEPHTLLDIVMKDGTAMRALLTRPATRFDLSADIVVEGTSQPQRLMLHAVQSAEVVT